jgi:hypothetical protein
LALSRITGKPSPERVSLMLISRISISGVHFCLYKMTYFLEKTYQVAVRIFRDIFEQVID